MVCYVDLFRYPRSHHTIGGAMRFDCKLDGFDGNWVDVSEVWTRREIAVMAAVSTPTALVDWLQKKRTACHIATVEGEAITSPADLTIEAIDERVDVRLYDFLGTVLIQAVGELRSVGPLSGRLSLKK